MSTLSQHEQQNSNFKDACQSLFAKLQAVQAPRGSTELSYENFAAAFSKAVVDPDGFTSLADSGQEKKTWISLSMSRLAIHMNDALMNEPEYFVELISIIAVCSRDQIHWANIFGQATRDSAENHETARQASDPDCVLEIARRALTLASRLTSSAAKDALKVIANCCADRNANREIVLERRGLDAMLALATEGSVLETLIPALFNVCSEYDRPPSYPNSIAHSETTGDHPRPSYAAERFAAVCNSKEDYTTFELLLSLSARVSEHIKPYLSLLVELAAEPALDGFLHIRDRSNAGNAPWDWSFSIDGNEYDTISLLLSLGREDEECFSSVVQAGVCLLSQHEAREGLLLRSDDAIWSVLTLASTADRYHNDDGESLDPDFEPARKVFVKHLYETTSDPSFPRDSSRASILIRRSLSELQSHVAEEGTRRAKWIQASTGSSESYRIASACIVMSQLALSESARESVVENVETWKILSHLFHAETSSDVLYPAVTIVSRTALSPRQHLQIFDFGTLEAMQRLLTAKGLGLVVPFETVTAYKTICRGRPVAVASLLSAQTDKAGIVEDILKLWNLTVEAGTKLEIGKFFLEILRTVLPLFREDAAVRLDDRITANQFEAMLDGFADAVGMVFTWLCTSADPRSQRDHGWFGLAMLSVWSSGRQSILGALEYHDLGPVMMEASQLQNGPVSNNLKLMLSNMQKVTSITVSNSSQQFLRHAARNLGLKWSVQDVNPSSELVRLDASE